MTDNKTIKYGLMDSESKKILGFEIGVYFDGFCEDSVVVLSKSADNQWLNDYPQLVEFTRNNEQKWHDSNMNYPVNPYNSSELKLVKVTTIQEIEEIDFENFDVSNL